jgi:hypothetical protein
VLVLQPVLVQSALRQRCLGRLLQGPLADGKVSQTVPNHARMIVSGGQSSEQVNVFRYYSKEPAPMGIADFGIGPSGPYEYVTNGSVGVVTVMSLSTYSAASAWPTSLSFQLNVDFVFNTSQGQNVYLVQDVAQIDTSSRFVQFLDNVWNDSVHWANMSGFGVSGTGQVAYYSTGSYYYDWANLALPGNCINLTYPATITLKVTSGTDSMRQPTVSFAYDDGYGLMTYDTLTFSDVPEPTSSIGFEVNGFAYNPSGSFYESELIMGGLASGNSTTDIQSDVQLQLEYSNGHNYATVPNAYNFGSNTAERIDNVTSEFSHCPENGTIIARTQAGAGQLGELYNQSQTGIIDVTLPLTSGTLYVTNASDPKGIAWQIPFVNGEVTVTLFPGYYNLQLYGQQGQLFDKGNFTVDAGKVLSLQTPLSPATHNVAVISVASAKNVIAKGFSDNVTVLVANRGGNAETFSVTAYVNGTVIGTQQVSLNATDQTIITFTWTTKGSVYGNYTMSAYAWPVQGETYIADNTFTGGTVYAGIPGDVNGDGKVNVLDAILLSNSFFAKPGSSNWNGNADVNGDGVVDILDAIILANNFATLPMTLRIRVESGLI